MEKTEQFIPTFRPQIYAEPILAELRQTINSGWIGNGPRVEEFERRLAEEVGTEHFICTSSGTAALHLAVQALHLPRGTRILTSPISFVSTTAAILWSGLLPVFGETRDGLLIDDLNSATGVLRYLEYRVVTHLGGTWCEAAAKGDPRFVVEDCCHAFGAPWIKRIPQNDRSMRCWSFGAIKPLPIGSGGGVSTNSAEIAKELRRLRWMGIAQSTFEREGSDIEYSIPQLGWKYDMSDIEATIGLGLLGSVGGWMRQRQRLAERYAGNLRWLRGPGYAPLDSSCHMYPLFVDDAAALKRELLKDSIGSSRHYRPLFQHPGIARRCAPVDPVVEKAANDYYESAIMLPLWAGLSDREQDRVIAAVGGWLNRDRNYTNATMEAAR